ncbi:mechanosensitive ion channel domain-containing protein [Kutzneria buriramensis]|uniref:Mechanosensitive ion channel-like protein n=1 Tax=Kutzneria buriramensis TaxID=1045776 RepID=A0A3E0H1N0_9PSEU|nr:mechanosensitive ion channel domain-containing protein [Kutzneria buriramensis]REH37012.1 mechanosensitive ion channel-like protein [Kutzneria buriramensis]
MARRLFPDTKRTIGAGTLAALIVIGVEVFGRLDAGAMLWQKAVSVGGALLFVGVMAVAIRNLGNVIVRHTQSHIGISHAGIIRLGISLVGYQVAVVTALGMLNVGIGQLLVGGALTGVVVGIACQQSLGNLFAGLVLLMSRPFTIGDQIVVHSGALGGPHLGMVIEMGLVYVVLETDDGVIRLPNSAVLAAGVGPRPVRDPAPAPHVAPDPAKGLSE